MSSAERELGNSVQFVTVEEDSVGQRLDNFLVKQLKGVPKSKLYKIIRKGEVRVNKGRAKPETKLVLGDRVRVPPIRVAPQGESVPPPSGLQQALEQSILFEDDGLLVINKPAGVAVHGGSNVSFGVIEALRAARPKQKFLELVHRLDRDTSGVLMLAKKRSVLTRLHAMLQSNRIEKRYLAWVTGKWPANVSEVTAPIRKNVVKSGERIVIVAKDGQPSHTKYRIIHSSEKCSLIEAQPITGRTHQIRVHCQFVGHPIVGDSKYCPSDVNDQFRKQGISRMCLHALSLRLKWDDAPIQFIEAPWEYAEVSSLTSL